MSKSNIWQPSDIQAVEENTDLNPNRKRGRIPQSAWPRIVAAYRSGTTLATIAREFDCTPSAISYVIKKAEAAGMGTSNEAAEAGEMQDAQGDGTVPPTDDEDKATTPAAGAVQNRDMISGTEPVAPQSSPPPHTTPAHTTPAHTSPAPTATPTPEPAQTERTTLSVRSVSAGPSDEVRSPTRITGQIGLKSVSSARPTADSPAPDREAAARPDPRAAAPSRTTTDAVRATAEPRPAEAPAQRPAAAARAEPAPVDATEGRLRETARACLVAYRQWRQSPGEQSIQSLGDSVHELRKTLSRIEIDMSVSRRDDHAARPIPVPWHRAARRGPSGGTQGGGQSGNGEA